MGAGTPATTLLTKMGISYRLHEYEHDPRVTNYGLEAATALNRAAREVFKTLIANVDGKPAVGIVSVDRQLDLKALASALGGKRGEMVDQQVAMRLTGYVVGGISPIGQKKALPTVIDSSAALYSTILVSAGRRGLDIELSPDDLRQACSAIFADIAS